MVRLEMVCSEIIRPKAGNSSPRSRQPLKMLFTKLGSDELGSDEWGDLVLARTIARPEGERRAGGRGSIYKNP